MIIVSGLERSGTSLMMQILKDAGFDVLYDDGRKPDIHNPKGYYELDDGKIITKLEHNQFDINKYKDSVIKITAYGIPLISGNAYTVIYMERDIIEVAESQRSMMKGKAQYIAAHNDIELLTKLNRSTKKYMRDNNINYTIINYNKLITRPNKELEKLSNFLDKDLTKSIRVIDKSLYRNRR